MFAKLFLLVYMLAEESHDKRMHRILVATCRMWVLTVALMFRNLNGFVLGIRSIVLQEFLESSATPY